jgi:hypothetical protein
MGGNTKKYQSAFFRSYFVPFCYAIKRYSLSVTHSKRAILQSLTSFYYYLFIFFLVFIPGITHPGWSALLPAAPLNSECRGQGGRATLSSPPRPTFTASITHSNFLKFVGGQNLASHHKTLFNCLPYFFNYCLLVISILLPTFNFLVQISILTLLRIFILFSGFFSL